MMTAIRTARIAQAVEDANFRAERSSPSATLSPGDLVSVFKLRIGGAIMICSLAGLAVTPGPQPAAWQSVALALAVLISAASAGAFNQYVERDLDAQMRRTRRRPFASGRFKPGAAWLAAILLLLGIAVLMAALSANPVSALYVFLGAFVYGGVYTIWLKRRSWTNIVVGGLAGSFAVLAGAAAVDPALPPAPIVLAIVLFLWTPPHFWSLAAALHEDYARAHIPMLPVLIGVRATSWVILGHALVLSALSLSLIAFGLGWIYLAGAIIGGALFVWRSVQFVLEPTRARAMANFHASLLQLGLLLGAAIADRLLLG